MAWRDAATKLALLAGPRLLILKHLMKRIQATTLAFIAGPSLGGALYTASGSLATARR